MQKLHGNNNPNNKVQHLGISLQYPVQVRTVHGMA
jgi:hypothetical protein